MASATPNPLSSRPWRVRARARSREIAAATRSELSYLPDIIFTLSMVVTGFLVAMSDLDDGSKIAVSALLATLNVTVIFGRSISRRLKALATDSLTVIPREELCRVIHEHLNHQREQLLNRASKLSKIHSCELEKHEMYAELIGLTDVVAKYRANTRAGTIIAISSTNIEDFDEEPLAEAYLNANRNAVSQGVVVRRLFLLSDEQRDSRQVKRLVREHATALEASNGGQQSAVRWLLKSQVAPAVQNEDFALFANEALVIQGPGERFEMVQEQDRVERATQIFDELWAHSKAKRAADLPERTRA